MKLSIIVPVYNSQEFLSRCLDSLLSQNVSDFEVIVINDGSTDSSQALIDNYWLKYPNIIKSFSLQNGGQGRARNFALNIAEGDYIGFVDSDDYIDAEMFSKLINLIELEDADIAVCNWYRFEGNKLYFEKYRSASNTLASSGAVWNKLYKRSLIGDLRFPEGLWYEDFAFSAKLLMKSNKTVFMEEALYYYRADNISTMRNKNSMKNLDMIEIMEDIRKSTETNQISDFEFLLINNVLLDSINRVALQNSCDKSFVINEFLKYIHKYIPDLDKCNSYKAENPKRQLIMKLNYLGYYRLSNFILKLKKTAV